MPDQSNNTSADNKRIAKNTIYLYLRMLFLLGISLFTSRVVLATLGVEDYGIYNVVGGIVSMLAFVNSAMGNSTARYITFTLGKGDMAELRKVFNATIAVHIIIGVIIVIVAETIGLWFLNYKMVIPIDRIEAANWVYQISVFTCFITICYIPFNATIIAHEKMSAFAYISILDAILKLLIVYAITITTADRLILYALLLMAVNIMDFSIYAFYCFHKFGEVKLQRIHDKSLIKEITSFAGWSMVGNLSCVANNEGLNILLNVFFGPAVNAARGIAFQVQGAIKGFVTNFQMAVNPQITKSYAIEDYKRLHALIYSSSKFSFYLLLCMVMPMAIESKMVLHLWLGEYPDYTVIFVILTLCTMLVDPLSNPIGIANNATGTIRNYQLVEGGTLLCVLPVAYIVLKLGGNPVSVFIVQLIILYFVQILRLFLVCHKIKMSITDYLSKVLFRVCIVTVAASILPLVAYFNLKEGISSCIGVIIISILSVLVFAYTIGIDKGERSVINGKIKAILTKIHNKA